MNRAATIALAPLSGIYRMIVTAREALYQTGVFSVEDVGAPVISVGNLTTGGTGKTPLVELIARELFTRGRHVCVLTRGYARENPRTRVIASNGKDLLATVHEAGDEAFMMAEDLLGKAAVVCDADRVAAARFARENLGADVLVLDDAFQHQRIARTLNLVTVDATNPWGNGWLLPAGQLREPPTALSRADCIVVTRAEAQETEALRKTIAKFAPQIPVLTCRTQFRGWRELGSKEPEEKPQHASVFAFCAIGNPDSFFSLLRSSGFAVAETRSFRDHHNYTQSDVDECADRAKAKGAQALLTTAKDAVKLRDLKFRIPCFVADVEYVVEPASELARLLQQAID